MKTKRLIAIIVSIAMLLPIMAFAQESMPVSRITEVLNSGKKIESTAKFEVSESFLGLIQSLSLDPTGYGEEEMEQMAKLQEAVSKLISKLRVDFVYSMESFSCSVGSEKAPLFNMAGKIDVEADEVLMSLDLLPGYVIDIKLPEGMLKTQIDAQNIEMVAKLEEAIEKSLEDYKESVLKPAFEKSEGNFIINDKEFDVKYAGMMDTHMVAKFMQIFAELINSNEEIKNIIEASIAGEKSALQQSALEDLAPEDEKEKLEVAGISLEKEPENADELIEEINNNAKELLDKDAESVANISMYENTANKDALVETYPVDGSAFLSVFVSESDKNMNIKILINGNEPEEEASADVDWKKLEEDIASGDDMSSVLIQIIANDLSDADNLSADVNANILVSGIPIGVNYTLNETKTGEYKGEQKMALTFMSAEPMITINVSSMESDKEIAPVAEGEKIIITEENSEEANEKINDLMSENATSVLIQNLSDAFPEEANIIMSSMMPPELEEGEVQSN